MTEHVQKALGEDRQLLTPLDELRGSEFITGIISGANNYVSGIALYTVAASNIIRGRPLNMQMHNRETAHVTIVYRDGSITGDIFAGPYTINPASQRAVTRDELDGRRFLSGVYAVVISGPTFAQGIDYNIGWIQDPVPTDPGGFLE